MQPPRDPATQRAASASQRGVLPGQGLTPWGLENLLELGKRMHEGGKRRGTAAAETPVLAQGLVTDFLLLWANAHYLGRVAVGWTECTFL